MLSFNYEITNLTYAEKAKMTKQNKKGLIFLSHFLVFMS